MTLTEGKEVTVFNFNDTELKGVAMEPIDSVEGFMAYLYIMKLIFKDEHFSSQNEPDIFLSVFTSTHEVWWSRAGAIDIVMNDAHGKISFERKVLQASPERYNGSANGPHDLKTERRQTESAGYLTNCWERSFTSCIAIH